MTNSFSKDLRNAAFLERFLRLMLLKQTATRLELGRDSGFSLASVTLGSKWLLENEFLQKSSLRVSSSKRPVEQLSLRVLPWSLLALRLSATHVGSELLDSTGHVIDSLNDSRSEFTQTTLFDAINEEIQIAKKRSNELKMTLHGVALSVDGMVSAPNDGIIFSLNNMPDWIPCSPRYMHPPMMGFDLVMHWTRIVCKLHGFARKLKLDKSLAYFEIYPHDLHLATMKDGRVDLGRFGTSGSFLHQRINNDPSPCFCGRTGCLDALLRKGQASHTEILDAIRRYSKQDNIEHVAIEWVGGATVDNVKMTEAVTGHSNILADEGRVLERNGLALLGTESLLLSLASDADQKPRESLN